jgi:poly-gamma-glutamate capsule biosynthesis protein CapA/YwtB (metallophosphatase superfamily)
LKNGQKPKILMIKFFTSATLFFLFLLSACSSPFKVRPIDNNDFWGSGYKVLLGGDFSYGDTYERGKEINENSGYDYPFAKVAPFLNSADFSIVNLETPITDVDIEPYTKLKTWVHRGKPDVYPQYIKKYRINAISLANNHTMDCGVEGLLETMKILDSNSILRMGAGSNAGEAAVPLIKDIVIGKDHIKLAIFAAYEDRHKKNSPESSSTFASAAQPGVNMLAPEEISKSIKAFKDKNPNGFVIVFPHWGSNYSWKSRSQTDLAEKLVDAGADIVIGHGSHLIQEIEKYKDKWIIYSLGNFVFNSPGRYEKKDTWPYSAISILRFSFENNKLNTRFRLYPIVTDNLVTNYQTHPVDKKDFNKTIELLMNKSTRSKALLSNLVEGRDQLGFYLEGIVLQ